MTLNKDNYRYLLALLTGFFIPISTVFTNLFCLLILIFIICEGENKERAKATFRQGIVIFPLLLFCLGIIGLFYSPIEFSEAGGILKKHREFLYIPMFLIFFRDDKSRACGLYGFLAAMGTTLFISYFVSITGYGADLGRIDQSGVFKNYITQNILMALATYFVIVQYHTNPRWKWVYAAILLLALYNILFVSLGRSGYVILFSLLFLLFFQFFRFQGIAIAGIVSSLLIVLLYSNSQVFQDRIQIISVDLARYEQGDVDLGNSIGSRLEYYQNSALLFLERPIIGAGTGGFQYEYKALADEKGILPTRHPHNEYLFIAVQWGSLGLGLFFCLLFLLWKKTSYIDKPQQLMAQGLTVTIIVGCLFNSLWLDTTEGHIFAYLIGAFYSNLRT